MDVGKAYGFLFEEENWIGKFLAGALFTFLWLFLIGIPITLGYMLELIGRVANKDAKPLPEWDNLGEKFMRGLVLFVVYIIYFAPVLLVVCLWAGLAAAAGQAGRNVANLMAGMGALLYCIVLMYTLAVVVIYPAAMVRFAATNRVTSAFEIHKIVGFIISNLGNYIIAILLGTAASTFIGLLVGALPCGIGLPFGMFWALLVQGHLYGQLYAASQVA